MPKVSHDAPHLLGVLADDTRWRLYGELRRAGRPLNRQEAAQRVGINPRLAGFHLEQLLDAGLLTAHYTRPAGRSGPGAGRTAKYYAPADVEVDLTIPQRRYDLVGALLVDAVEAADGGVSARETALRVAARRGRELGEDARRRFPRANDPQGLIGLTDVLEYLGYEPYPTPHGGLALRNCPFHALAQRSPELVCALNHALLSGVLQGLQDHQLEALLACCEPGNCCVILDPQPPGRVPTADGA